MKNDCRVLAVAAMLPFVVNALGMPTTKVVTDAALATPASAAPSGWLSEARSTRPWRDQEDRIENFEGRVKDKRPPKAAHDEAAVAAHMESLYSDDSISSGWMSQTAKEAEKKRDEANKQAEKDQQAKEAAMEKAKAAFSKVAEQMKKDMKAERQAKELAKEKEDAALAPIRAAEQQAERKAAEKEAEKQINEEIEVAEKGRSWRNGDPQWQTAEQRCAAALANCRDGRGGKHTVQECHEDYRSCEESAAPPGSEKGRSLAPAEGSTPFDDSDGDGSAH